MRTILFRIESPNGDDEKLVPEDKLVEEVNKQVAEDKWVTLSKSDGSSELVTGPIAEAPKAEDKPKDESWKNAFGGATKPAGGFKDLGTVTGATATSKLKGG